MTILYLLETFDAQHFIHATLDGAIAKAQTYSDETSEVKVVLDFQYSDHMGHMGEPGWVAEDTNSGEFYFILQREVGA